MLKYIFSILPRFLKNLVSSDQDAERTAYFQFWFQLSCSVFFRSAWHSLCLEKRCYEI